MAIIMQQVMPEGVTLELLDEVTDEMRADENRPEGMVVHVHFERDGRVHVVDVWDSQEAYEWPCMRYSACGKSSGPAG